MFLDQCAVFSLRVFEYTALPTKNIAAGREYHALSFRKKGESVLTANGESHISKAGSITFVPANIDYQHQIMSESETIVVHFSTQENIGNNIEIFYDLPRESEILFHTLLKCWNDFPFENSFPCMVLLYQMLDIIRQSVRALPIYSRASPLDYAANHLYANFRDAGYSLKKLYDDLHVTEAYLRRVFKKKYNCSPSEFLKKLRIDHAKMLLISNLYDLSKIAQLSGFASQTYFSFAFRQSTGQSPTEYVKEQSAIK